MEQKKKEFQKVVLEHALIVNRTDLPSRHNETYTGDKWIFDFRTILLQPKYLEQAIELLYDKLRDYDNYQIGGLESAAIPLVTGLVLRAHADGKNVNGFYIRKSRKKTGLHKVIEGKPNTNPVILIDDLINTSSSVTRQIAVLDKNGFEVCRVLTLVRFRHKNYYKHLADRSIAIDSIYRLSDFGLSLPKRHRINIHAYDPVWTHRTEFHSPSLVLQKSTPALADQKLFFGTDSGYIQCIDATNGTLIWSVIVGQAEHGKSILSSPLISDGIVFIGSYDGKLYALNAQSGQLKWLYSDCEWIGSSPAISEKYGLIYIGVEYGHPQYKGAIVALDSRTGEIQWEYKMRALTHASPLVLEETNEVFIGSNEGILFNLRLDTGDLNWRYITEGGLSYPGIGGFGNGGIKLAPIYDRETDTIAFSSMDGSVYVLDRASGALRWKTQTELEDTTYRIGFYASPLFVGNHLIAAGLDKLIYCCDKKTGARLWTVRTGGRIFATPVAHDGKVYVGSNDGILYGINILSGRIDSKHHFPERITCPVVFNDKDHLMYVTTNDNAVHAISSLVR